ncbi:RNA-directed DNA polymerase, eukaryota [Tanacetum coccineum]|uniref:RNA-directed DNA polymerase, eukaryota n=1 Tax=Tanacetum coccineum TaxID=301880 RepID=A0ABQ4X987_9ASTR
MFFKVDFAKAYDSVRWDYLLEVLEAFGFGRTWCNWIRGTLTSAKASILINGSPSKEYSCHRGLKQGDPLAPYLFILIMESLHLSFNRVVDEGLFKGIQLPGSLSLSHLFYADDAMFIGEWSNENLSGIINILKSFFLASGLQINILKSQLLGVCVPHQVVEQAASLIGLDDVILKLRSRLLSGRCLEGSWSLSAASGSLGFFRFSSPLRSTAMWRSASSYLGGLSGTLGIGSFLKNLLQDVRKFLML